MLVSSEEARHGILRVSPDTFEGHEGEYWTVVSPEGRHTTSELLRPYPSEAIRAYPVRTVVNSPKNDGPECIEPAA